MSGASNLLKLLPDVMCLRTMLEVYSIICRKNKIVKIVIIVRLPSELATPR